MKAETEYFMSLGTRNTLLIADLQHKHRLARCGKVAFTMERMATPLGTLVLEREFHICLPQPHRKTSAFAILHARLWEQYCSMGFRRLETPNNPDWIQIIIEI